MSNHYFTADLHLGHKNIIEHTNRPFVSLKEMNLTLIDEINFNVKPNDILWVLGDFCWNGKNIPYYRTLINCRTINLIKGNHDKKPDKSQFHTIRDKHTLKLDGQKIVLSHEPFAIWHCRHYGAWHLYGHSHGNAEDWLDEIMPGRLSMDVGVDNIYKLCGKYRPISDGEIYDIMKDKKGFGLIK